MNPVPPLCLTPDGAKLLANTELLRLSAELSEIYASKEMLVTDEVLQAIGVDDALQQAKYQVGQGILRVEAVVILAMEVNRYRKISE